MDAITGWQVYSCVAAMLVFGAAWAGGKHDGWEE